MNEHEYQPTEQELEEERSILDDAFSEKDRVEYPEPDTTEYMLSNEVSAARSLVDLDTKKGIATQPRFAETAERLVNIEERFNFKPLSRNELSDVYDLTGKDLPGGAAQQLNIIFNRQKKYMDDPDRTVRSIVGRYVAYAENARAEASFISELINEIEEAKAHKFASADSISVVSLWKDEPAIARPLLHLLRSRDASAFMSAPEGEEVPLEDGLGKYSLSEKNTQERLKTMVDGLRVGDLLAELFFSRTQEKNRFTFWTKALEESRSHAVARGVAGNGLIKLGVINQL